MTHRGIGSLLGCAAVLIGGMGCGRVVNVADAAHEDDDPDAASGTEVPDGSHDGSAGAIDAGDTCASGLAGTWVPLAPADVPPPRYEHAMAYDPSRQRIVLFGGRTGPDNDQLLDDTWEWDGDSWLEVATADAPAPRAASAMVFDSALGAVMLYGGFTSGGGTADTWRWEGTFWEPMSTNESPSFRHGHGLVYDDARGRALLHGGFLGGVGLDDELWQWDGVAAVWEPLPQADNRPGPRLHHAFVFEVTGDMFLLYGGIRNGLALGDTWEYDGTNWAEAVTGDCSPPAAGSPAMAYDGTRALLYDRGETWEWDGERWAAMAHAGRPNADSGHAMVYASGAGALVLFGGLAEDGSTPLGETWVLAP
jgi:hypothetical protein